MKRSAAKRIFRRIFIISAFALYMFGLIITLGSLIVISAGRYISACHMEQEENPVTTSISEIEELAGSPADWQDQMQKDQARIKTYIDTQKRLLNMIYTAHVLLWPGIILAVAGNSMLFINFLVLRNASRSSPDEPILKWKFSYRQKRMMILFFVCMCIGVLAWVYSRVADRNAMEIISVIQENDNIDVLSNGLSTEIKLLKFSSFLYAASALSFLLGSVCFLLLYFSRETTKSVAE